MVKVYKYVIQVPQIVDNQQRDESTSKNELKKRKRKFFYLRSQENFSDN